MPLSCPTLNRFDGRRRKILRPLNPTPWCQMVSFFLGRITFSPKFTSVFQAHWMVNVLVEVSSLDTQVFTKNVYLRHSPLFVIRFYCSLGWDLVEPFRTWTQKRLAPYGQGKTSFVLLLPTPNTSWPGRFRNFQFRTLLKILVVLFEQWPYTLSSRIRWEFKTVLVHPEYSLPITGNHLL